MIISDEGLSSFKDLTERFTSLQLLWKQIKRQKVSLKGKDQTKENLMESLDQGAQKVLQWHSSVDISMTATSCKRYLM